MDIDSIRIEQETLIQHLNIILDYMKSNNIFNIKELDDKISQLSEGEIGYIYSEFKILKEKIFNYLQLSELIKSRNQFEDYGVTEEEVNTVISMCREKNFEIIINQEFNSQFITQKKLSDYLEISPVNNPSSISLEKNNPNHEKSNLITTDNQVFQINDQYNCSLIVNQPDETEIYQYEKENDIMKLTDSFIKYLKYLEYLICKFLNESYNITDKKSLFKQQQNVFQEIWNQFEYFYIQNKIKNFDEVEKLKNSLKIELFDNNSFKESLNIISKIKSKVIPLDLKKLKFFYEKSILAVEKIKDKNVVAILGNSNAGKSTTTFYLAGSEMKQIMINGKIPHIYSENFIYKELEEIKTSYKALSETRYVVAFQVKYEDINLKGNNSIYIADLPGLFENRDIETEITNNLGITKFLKACKTLKILYILNYKDMVANNCQGVRDLIDIIVSLVGSVEKHIEKFLFAINKANKFEFEELKERIENLEDQLTEEENNNPSFKRALNAIAERIKNSSILINPLNKDELNKVYKKIEICKEFIYPGNVFNLTLSQNANLILMNYISSKDKLILNALENSDISFLKDQIEELSFFNDIEEMNELHSKINKIYEMIKNNLDGNFEKLVKIINDVKENNNPFNQSQVIEIEDSFRRSQKLDEITFLLPDDKKNCFKFPDVKKFIENFILETFKVELPQEEHLDIQFFSNINKKLTNIYLISNKLQEYREDFMKFYNYLKGEILKNILEDFKKYFSEFKYEESYRYFLIVKNLDKIISHFSPEFSDLTKFEIFNLELNVNNKDDTELSEKLRADIKLIFERNIENVCEIFLNEKKNMLSKEKILEMKDLINEINFINESRISDLFDKVQLRETNEKIGASAKTYIKKRNENINSMIISDEKLIIDDLINEYNSLKLISEIEKISHYVWKTYRKTCEILGMILTKINNSYKSSFDSIFSDNFDDILFKKNIDNICLQIKLINDSKLIHLLDSNFKEKFDLKIKSDFDDYIKTHLKKANYGIGISYNEGNFLHSVSCFCKISIINETLLATKISNDNYLENEFKNLGNKIQEFLNEQIVKIKEEDIKLNLKAFKNSFLKRIYYLENLKLIKFESLKKLIDSLESSIDESTQKFKNILSSGITNVINLFMEKNFKIETIDNDIKIIKLGYECLNEMEEIKMGDQYSFLFSIINENKDYNIELIRNTIYELKQYFQREIQNNNFNIDLNTLKNILEVLLENLIHFDRLNLNCYHQFSFSKLNELCYEIIKNSFPTIQIRDKDKIFSNDYLGLVESFVDIKSDLNNPINQRRKRELEFELNRVIRNLSNKIYSLLKVVNADYINEENIKEIEENSKTLNNINHYLKDHINVDEIEKTMKFTSDKIKKLFEMMKNQFIGYFKSSLFANAENIFKKLYIYTTILGNVQTGDLDFNEIANFKNEELEKIKENYKKEDLVKYRFIQPNRLFEQFNKDDILSNIEMMGVYKTFSNELTKIIDEKYSKRIFEILNGNIGLSEKEEQLQELEKTTDYLPDDLKKYQLKQITKEKNHLQETNKNLEKSIHEYITFNNYKSINAKYTDYWSTELRKKVENYLMDQAKLLLDKIGTEKDNKDPHHHEKFKENIFDNYDFYNNTTKFTDLLSSSEKKYKKTINNIVKNICKLEKEFFNLNSFKTYFYNKLKEKDFSNENKLIAKMIEDSSIFINPNYFRELILLSENQNITQNFIPDLKDQIKSGFSEIEKSLEIIDEINKDLYKEDVISSIYFLGVYNYVQKFYFHLRIIFDDEVKNVLKNNIIIQNSKFIDKITYFKSHDDRKNEFEKFIEGYKDDIFNFKYKLHSNVIDIEQFFKLLDKKVNTYTNFFLTFNNEHDILNKTLISINNQINELKMEILNFDISKEHYEDEYIKEININYKILKNVSEKFPIFKDDINSLLKKTKDNLIDILENIKIDHMKNFNYSNISYIISKLKKLSFLLNYFKKEFEKNIEDYFKHIKSNSKNHPGEIFDKLGQHLQNEGEWGYEVIRNYNIFEGLNNRLYTSLTNKFDIKYVLDNLQIRSVDEDLKSKNYYDSKINNFLNEKYQEYFKEFKQLIEKNLCNSEKGMKTIREKLKLLIGDYSLENNNDKIIPSNLFQQLPIILAHISAIFTINKSKNYYNVDNSKFEDKNLYIVHPAQIIAIFQTFCLETKKSENICNNMIQIGTGEGKSIILGLISIIFALLGYEVSVACYSSNLSMRDFESFKCLFNFFGISNSINYGNLYNLSERIINREVDLKKYFTEIIFYKNVNYLSKNKVSNKYQVLLFDEIDVFFSKDFYGKLYSSSLLQTHQTINDLFQFIWDKRKLMSDELLENIKNSNEYAKCKEMFNDWHELLDENLKDILYDLNTYESHQYFTFNNKICYKDNDEIVYNRRFGYKTVFAYFKEYENGKITRESLLENIGLTIKCSNFSFSEIPKIFDYIFGVSGTIETLGVAQKNIIANEYDIRKYTILPSVFGKNNLKFDKHINFNIENDENNNFSTGNRNVQYYYRIKEEINNGKIGLKSGKPERSVIVFFKDLLCLNKYLNENDLIRKDFNIISEDLNRDEIQNVIKFACSKGTVTLSTASFGRGYDFIIKDPLLNAEGGIHIIQTFLSDDFSEETQIRGRTARQGNQGSYCLIIKFEELYNQFGITNEKLEQENNKYDFVSKIRNNKNEIIFNNNKEIIKQVKNIHLESANLLECIRRKNFQEIKQQLLKINKGVIYSSFVARTKIYLDATASMEILIEKLKYVVTTIFSKLTEILRENEISENSFSIQIVLFRNYDQSQEDILVSSGWEMKPENLFNFLNSTKCFGGWGNEAIELCLNDALKESRKLTNIIIFSDSASNTQEKTSYKRKEGFKGNFKESLDYWNNSNFKDVHDIDEELSNIKIKKIPIYGFYVENMEKNMIEKENAEVFFKKISKESCGMFQKINVQNEKEGYNLAKLISNPIISAIGDSTGDNDKKIDLLKSLARVYV